jgi:multiple sugar transport system permease protein
MTTGAVSVAAGNRFDRKATVPTTGRLDGRRFQWGSIPLLGPAGVLLVVLFLAPVAYSFYLGLTNLELIGPTSRHYHFTGFDNITFLIHDAVFHQSLYLTAFFVIGSGVIGATGVGLALALAMQKAINSLRLLIGAIVMLCFMLPPITAAILWYAASTSGGSLPTLFGTSGSDFLHSAPMVIVSAANAWSVTGLAMLLFAAALRNIPGEIMEAAELENSNAVQRFVRITLPILKPTIVTTVLLITLLSLANFTLVYLMTQGGPGNSTMILPVYSYQQAFTFSHLAYGALVGNVMVIIATIFSALFVYFSRERRTRED